MQCFGQEFSNDPAGPAQPDAVKALVLASRAFVALAARSLAAVDDDVTLPQFRVLVVLVARGPQRSSDIAEELRVNPSTATRMLDRLIRKGLVRRSRSTSDRRTVRVRATEAGWHVVEQTMAHRRAELRSIVGSTRDLWQPKVVTALTAFAEAFGENDDGQWWLDWNEQHPDTPMRAER